MLAAVATIAAAVAVGVFAERRLGELARSAARRALLGMLYVVVPFVVFFNLARLRVNVDVAGGIVLAYVMMALVGVLAYVTGRRLLHLDRPSLGALVVTTIQVNTGYVGFPLIITLLGSRHLAQGIAYDSLVTQPILFVAVFALGAAFGTEAGETTRQRVRAFVLRNPPLLAAIAAFLVPDSWAPESMVHLSRILVLAVIPLGFFAVGVTLASEADEGQMSFPPPLTRPVAVSLALRLLVAPVLLYALALPFIHLPRAYLLLAAMPAGLNCLTVAHAYGLDLKLSASAVAWSTALVLAAGTVASLV